MNNLGIVTILFQYSHSKITNETKFCLFQFYFYWVPISIVRTFDHNKMRHFTKLLQYFFFNQLSLFKEAIINNAYIY